MIYKKSWLDQYAGDLPLWQQTSYQTLNNMVTNEKNMYPCIPAQQGFSLDQLRFGFVCDPRNENAATEFANCIKEYGELSRTAGKYTSLAILFETPQDLIESYDVEDYRNLFWNLLSQVTTLDEKDWPDDIPDDPSHYGWEFCFDGEPYFVFCATPAHKARKSRHFPSLLLALRPRFVFTKMNNSTPFGRNLKKLIRQRIEEYDDISAHPDLKWYGQEDNHEWKQYFLSDDDSTPSACPFHRMAPNASVNNIK